jgi:hypothetical protein
MIQSGGQDASPRIALKAPVYHRLECRDVGRTANSSG